MTTPNEDRRSRLARETFRKHTGFDHDPKSAADDPPSMKDLSRITFENTYADSWSRTELDLRAKCFISMSITATLGTEDQFKAHVRAAHHSGITKDEIVGMLIHFMGYLGAPRTSVARKLVREVWKEMGKG